MKKIPLEVIGISTQTRPGESCALVMGEIGGKRRLPIIIGAAEGHAIALETEGIKSTRPLTHDLMRTVMQSYGIQVLEVVIYNLEDGVFHSKLLCEGPGEKMEVDCRTSDAVALAVRFKCPIFTYESILDEAGIIMEGNELQFLERLDNRNQASTPKPTEKKGIKLEKASLKQLKTALKKAVDDENYEEAARIRDELSRREKP